MFWVETRSVSLLTRPAKASSVYTLRATGGVSRLTGAAPPNVQAYSPGSGR
jgi:hypothetical protein